MSCSKVHFEKLTMPSFTQDDPIGNINLAMEIAEKHLDIPKMLDAEGEATCVADSHKVRAACGGHAQGSPGFPVRPHLKHLRFLGEY